MALEQRTGWWKRWWPFLLLCCVGSVRWWLWEAVPAASSTLLSLAVGCGTACLVTLTLASRRGQRRGLAVRDLLRVALAGTMLLCGPLLAQLAGTRSLEVSALVLSLALTPVVVAVARPVFRPTEGAEIAGRLWPGIAAMAGLLLVLPQPSLAIPRNVVLLVAMPVVTGTGAMWLRSLSAPKMLRAAIGLGAATVVFLLAGAAQHALQKPPGTNLWAAAALDGLVALSSVLALVHVGATRWSSQFVMIPLLLLLEGAVAMRLWPTPRMAVGLALLVLASAFLLIPPSAVEPDVHPHED